MPAPRPLDPARHSRLLCALAEEASTHTFVRKLLVCRRQGVGLELLRALATAGVPWIGFEATTPQRLALELIDAGAAGENALLDEFDEQALIDEAIDDALHQAGAADRFTALAEGVGLRRALAHAVRSLRLGGIAAAAVRRLPDEPVRRDTLAAILARYDELRRDRRRMDTADLFMQAAIAVGNDARMPRETRILLVPGHDLRGLSGALLRALVQHGAVALPEDGVAGLTAPAARLRAEPADAPVSPLGFLHDIAGAPSPPEDLALYAATSIEAELREVLRRIVAAGARWDEAEIAATDPAAYAVALDGLARRLGVPVSYAGGLPVARTRPGRVIATYLRWVEDDFREDVIRGLIERSDIEPGGTGVPSGPSLARRLRGLRIGRGRDRYLDRIQGALRALEHDAGEDADEADDRSAEEREQYRDRQRLQLRALESMLRPILDATPDGGAAVSAAQRRMSAAELARGARAVLDLTHAVTDVDRVAKERLTVRLDRIAATLTRTTTLRGAIAMLVDQLDDRVPAPEAGGRAPWLSSGGRLHFTDIDGAGVSGRRLTFIVGVDAGRFPDASMDDALLSDSDRVRLSDGHAVTALSTRGERIDDRRYALAAALARLRGRVTLSYAAWNAAEGRAVAPAAELLQAFRLRTGDADADYDALHRALTPHASAVPQSPRPGVARVAQLDVADVWLAALDVNGLLRRGSATVAAAYPALARGLAAAAARKSDVAGAFHGVIQRRPSFDPRTVATPVSASRLETLGRCPHKYLLQYVLGVRPARATDTDPGRWLDSPQRGAVLHEVFERTLREALRRGIAASGDREPADEDADGVALYEIAGTMLEAVLAGRAEEQPPPGPAVYEAERRALHADARAFVQMLLESPRDWIAFEEAFGEESAPVLLQLDGGSLRIRGRIDRIDRAADRDLVVVDYKTGSTRPFRRETGTYAGGRRLQHAFYRAGAEALHEGSVRRVEYVFPGEHGRNERVVYDRSDIHDAARLIEHLLEMAAQGWFPPTNDAKEDCRFCDMRAVCRVQVRGAERVDSPLAEWSSGMLSSDAEALRALRTLRQW